ncbi:LmeA family phospholipid-binding protein [Phaeacidiphilus oryzae]|uniref:LmeA family phospholipid-binding protein n=1 Tax=Phaeacidiphilus oryzae TaxID=348818 RepID=UPI001377C935|nr:DUF2993 domain-containing protein [Phaeacidiphilus oryzae]
MRRLIITLVVLCALFVAADRISVAVVQGKMASRIQAAGNLSSKPDLSIRGFPFLTQLVAKKLDDVKVSANDLTLSDGSGAQVTIRSIDADLRGVLLQNGYSSATVQNGTGSILLSYADVSKAMGHGLSFAYGGDDRVRISGQVTWLGIQIKGSGRAGLKVLSGDSVAPTDISVDKLTGAGVSLLPGDPKSVVKQLFDTSFKIPNIPAGLSLESVEARPDGVLVSLSGSNLKLNQ